ncbi:hypothetical protein [Bacillus wiedmannii]|uniref:hypothetical protein n=1 Tax=Bacillus wiedmannii TaxID=1890302 RepID=UPI00211D986B|nr:hypothetical protein [Bacillus wiedmannii]
MLAGKQLLLEELSSDLRDNLDGLKNLLIFSLMNMVNLEKLKGYVIMIQGNLYCI